MTAELVPVSQLAANSSTSAPGRPFAKGTSGNPSGRHKGTALLAQRIRRETKDGRVVVNFQGGDDTARDVALAANGRIVVGGEGFDRGNRRFAVARLLAA